MHLVYQEEKQILLIFVALSVLVKVVIKVVGLGASSHDLHVFVVLQLENRKKKNLKHKHQTADWSAAAQRILELSRHHKLQQTICCFSLFVKYNLVSGIDQMKHFRCFWNLFWRITSVLRLPMCWTQRYVSDNILVSFYISLTAAFIFLTVILCWH